jgi:hypothetical protein
LKAKNANAGFRGSGLYPVDREKPMKKVTNIQESDVEANTTTEEETPRKRLTNAFLKSISPEVSEPVALALQNNKKKRKRVQGKTGEVLTRQEVLDRLQQEQTERQAFQIQICHRNKVDCHKSKGQSSFEKASKNSSSVARD